MKNASPSLRTALLNSATDPAFQYCVGSIVLSMPVSRIAAGIHAGRAALCFATRLVNEFQKAGMSAPVPAAFKRFAAGNGASMIVSGGTLAAAAAASAFGIDPGNPATVIPAASLGLFTVTSVAQGLAINRHAKGHAATGLEITARLSCAAALCLTAGPSAPWLLYAIFGAGAASAVALAVKGKAAHGALQPELYYAAGCGAASFNAFAGGDAVFGTVNLIYAGGHLALDSLRKYGGVAERLRHLTGLRTLSPQA